MSDVEDDWKPNGRPTSMLALSFAASLDSVFELDPKIETLSRSIASKRRSVSIQQAELENLQARIREAEERLNGSSSSDAPASASLREAGRAPARKSPGLSVPPVVESDEDEDETESSESSAAESEDDGARVNKQRNSQSTAQTSQSEASSSESDEADEETSEEEEEQDEVVKRSQHKQPVSPSARAPVGKQPLVKSPGKAPVFKQGQSRTLASRGKA